MPQLIILSYWFSFTYLSIYNFDINVKGRGHDCKQHIILWWYTQVPNIVWLCQRTTTGPWATSLTWEKCSNQKTHMILRMLIQIRKNPLPTLWELNGSSFDPEAPSPKDAVWQVWLKLAKRFWRRFLNFVYVIFLFHNYLPLEMEKGLTLHLNKLEYSSP